jgi:hypothetical protein
MTWLERALKYEPDKNRKFEKYVPDGVTREEFEAARAKFHEAWSKAASEPGYDKHKWIEKAESNGY